MIINALSPTSKSQCFSLALTGDSEKVRHTVQNKFVHDIMMDLNYFKVMEDRKPQWHFQFTTGTGDSLW
jgi:hypothetical protein